MSKKILKNYIIIIYKYNNLRVDFNNEKKRLVLILLSIVSSTGTLVNRFSTSSEAIIPLVCLDTPSVST